MDFLDCGDGGLRTGAAEEDSLIARLRLWRPDLVLGPTPADRHPDHGRAHRLVEAACFYAGLRNRAPEAGEPFRPAAQDAKLAHIFFAAGPQRVIDEMTDLLGQVQRNGLLRIDNPVHAAEHFFCLIKGGHNFRLMCGCAEPMETEDAEAHVREVVELFIRAYRP